MAEIVRHRNYKIIDDDGKAVVVRLKRWSASKLFFVVREFWSKIEDGLSKIEDVGALTDITLVRIIIEQVVLSGDQAAMLVCLSIDDPKGLKNEDVLEWDAESFIGVISAIVEMNWTDSLRKNFGTLLANFFKNKKKQAGSEKKKSEKAAATPV